MNFKSRNKDAEILIVDDALASLDLMTKILAEKGYRIRPASSGQLALRSAASKVPDLVLLDVKMPGMDGYQVCRALKSDPENADVPVIFISGLEDTIDKVRGFEAGGVDFITKPFQAEEVFARVETHLNLRHLTRELKRQNILLKEESARRRKKEAALQELNEFNRKIFETANTGVLAYDGDSGQCVMANPAAARILNGSVDQLLAQNFNRISAFQTQERMALVKRVISTGVEDHHEIYVETCFGRKAWMQYRASRFMSRGKPHLLLILDDISEQRQFQESLRRAKETAEAINNTKSEFLANISHEIRTPLNSVIGFSDLLYESIHDPVQKKHIELIQAAGHNLLRLVNDLLDLSKIEAGKLDLSYSPTSLPFLIEGIKQMFLPQTAEKGLEFITEIDSKLPDRLLLDEVRIRQVLMNLVGNAVKFTQNGHVKVLAEVAETKHPPGGQAFDVGIRVEDTGMGIEEDQMEKIFESFVQQTGQGAEFGGTGLGLAICKRLVEMMGGGISVESRTGHGSTFTVSIPDVACAAQIPGTVAPKAGNMQTPSMAMATDTQHWSVNKINELLQAFASLCPLQEPANLSKLKDIIDTQFMDQWEKFKNLISMKAVRQFGKELEALGDEYAAPPISSYGKELVSGADDYDVNAVEALVKIFPDIVNKLKS